ncbi:MAG: uroporphyrinogen decarboxylase family protein [Planctomycetota bacterium]
MSPETSLDQINVLTKLMTERERFLRYMHFQPVDRIPLMEMGLWPETIERWHHEGLPKWVTSIRHLEDFLRLDRSFNVNWLEINGEIYPPFEEKVLEETEEEQVVSDANGIIYRQRKSYKTIPNYIRFPIENEADYMNLLPRLDGTNPGFFGFPRNYMGLKNWSMAFYDQPQLVKRIIADRLQFGKDLLKRVLSTGYLDFVQIWEDMAYKTSPMISPDFVREYMLPAYKELVAYLRDGGVTLVMVDTDGRGNDLLPIFLEAGIDGMHPCEIAAGCDPVILRQKHPKCTLMGGLDKRAIASGREGVESELNRVQPVLEQGAYIPMLDHFVPPDVSYQTYLYYVERRRELLSRPYG